MKKKDFIQLKTDDILRFGIKDNEGNITNEYLEFDLKDTALLLKYQDVIEGDKRNKQWLKMQLNSIEKRQDIKTNKYLSRNEEDAYKAVNTFFKKEIEVYNIFLGKNGVQKILCGRKINWDTLERIDKLIEKDILPHLKIEMENITKKIKEKYSIKTINDAGNILK